MTIEALTEGIKRLIIKRQNTNPANFEDLDKINQKLDKLYNLKYLYYKQQKQFNI